MIINLGDIRQQFGDQTKEKKFINQKSIQKNKYIKKLADLMFKKHFADFLMD